MKENRKYKSEGRKHLKEGELDKVPEFYKNLAGGPKAGRLRSLNVKLQSPYIIKFISGKIISEPQTVDFGTTFKNIPLVVGLLKKTTGLTVPIYPNNFFFTTTESNIVFNGNFTAIGDQYKLRIYNLDI